MRLDKIFKEANLLKLNCDKARKILNWKSIINFENTLRFTAYWYQQSLKHPSSIKEVTSDQVEWFLQNHLLDK